MNTSATHVINPVATEGHGQYKGQTYNVRIVIEGSENRGAGYAVSGWGAGQFNRKVFQGELVEGPHASLFGLATCIAAEFANSTAGEKQREAEEGRLIHAAPGDVLVIDGHGYDLALCRRGYPVLTPRGLGAFTL